MTLISGGNGPQTAAVSLICRQGKKLGRKERCKQWLVGDNGTDGDRSAEQKEEMSHSAAVNRVLVKRLLEQLHSNTVDFSENMALLLLLEH